MALSRSLLRAAAVTSARATAAAPVAARAMGTFAKLDWTDPLDLKSLLTDDEKMIMVRGRGGCGSLPGQRWRNRRGGRTDALAASARGGVAFTGACRCCSPPAPPRCAAKRARLRAEEPDAPHPDGEPGGEVRPQDHERAGRGGPPRRDDRGLRLPRRLVRLVRPRGPRDRARGLVVPVRDVRPVVARHAPDLPVRQRGAEGEVPARPREGDPRGLLRPHGAQRGEQPLRHGDDRQARARLHRLHHQR